MNQRVADAFKKLSFGKSTGVLTCESRSARRAVLFQSGFVVGARSTLDEDRLGELMLRHERITRQQFDDASHFIKSGWKLGAILVELKVIEPDEVEFFVRLQLLDIACMQLVSPPKGLSFSPLSAVDAFVEAPVSVADILMEAARRTPKIGPHLEALKSEPRRLGFPKDPLKRFQDLNLKPEEAFVLSRIDGTETPGDIFAVSPLPEEDTARTLLGLLQAGVIEPEGEGSLETTAARKREGEPAAAGGGGARPRPSGGGESTRAGTAALEGDRGRERERERERAEIERIYQEFQFRDHWQVLGLERGATRKAVKEAFFNRAKTYHPDRYRRITDPEFHEKVSYVFQRVHEAYETLGSAAAAARYEELSAKEAQYERTQKEWNERTASSGSRGAPKGAKTKATASSNAGSSLGETEAKAILRRARQAFKEDDFWTAIELARQAIDASPETAASYHLLGLALAKNPKWRQDAEKNLKIAVQLDSWNVQYLVDLGKLYEEAGLHLRARRTFEQAKALDPDAPVPSD